MELNIIVFIPLLRGGGTLYALENSLKYFLIQRVASVWFLWTSALSTFLAQGLGSFVGVLAIMIKLGMAPFHGWFISVVSNVSFGLIFSLSTLQKVIPLLVLRLLPLSPYEVGVFVGLTLATVLLLGLSQVSVRKILAISSLNNVS